MNENNIENNNLPVEPQTPEVPTEPVAPVEQTVVQPEPVAETSEAPTTEVNTVPEQPVQPVVQETPVQQPTETVPVQTEVKEEKKKSSCLPIIIVVVILFILAIVGVVVGIIIFAGKGNKGGSGSGNNLTTSSTTTTTSADDEDDDYLSKIDFENVKVTKFENEASENIEIVKFSTAYDTINVALINKNDHPVDVEVKYSFFMDDDFVNYENAIRYLVEPNVITVIDEDLRFNEAYNRVTVEVIASESNILDQYEFVKDYTFVKINEDKKDVDDFGEFTNNLDKDVRVRASCIRYKGDNIAYVHVGYIVSPKPHEVEKCKCYSNEVPKSVDFDRTECIVSSVSYEK
ncbi:MAG: hypothetical protein IKP76_00395 [Bacilli bacterium]|nr:hypothetical protein [Bacilli bacterium]